MNAATKTAPAGSVVRPSMSLDAVLDEVRSLRYMPLADFDRAALDLAMRLLNAEQTAYDLAVRK